MGAPGFLHNINNAGGHLQAGGYGITRAGSCEADGHIQWRNRLVCHRVNYDKVDPAGWQVLRRTKCLRRRDNYEASVLWDVVSNLLQ